MTLQQKIESKPTGANLGVTFRESKRLPFHRWYPYVEGFSSEYIEELLEQAPTTGVVYDPFGGSGTVNVIAAQRGRRSAFSEAIPLMQFIAQTKVNSVLEASGREAEIGADFKNLLSWCASDEFDAAVSGICLSQYAVAFSGRDFFAQNDIQELLAIKSRIVTHGYSELAVSFMKVALASITVSCSHMTRRADLRRRRDGEYLSRVVDVRGSFSSKLHEIEADLQGGRKPSKSCRLVGSDARVFSDCLASEVSLILTSPPYLNGTNYIRNTKLELWLLDFIASEKELSEINAVCMVCGINNVQKSRLPTNLFPEVEVVATQLDEVSPDKRIPQMVRGYFSDMMEVLSNCGRYLSENGRMILDIGDSRFYGVNVPTDRLLVTVAESAGLKFLGEKTLARRLSKDKTPLRQVELTFSRA